KWISHGMNPKLIGKDMHSVRDGAGAIPHAVHVLADQLGVHAMGNPFVIDVCHKSGHLSLASIDNESHC
ncbi:hypothetical protein, partial [Chromobacterium phragmitis]|uniref:hypothetical protein n=1 Tax=Chromobacterium phragmitis TaxID=2202141 RepID=UPI003263FCB0